MKLGKSALRRVRTALEHEHLGTGLVALAIWFAFAVRPMPDTSTDIDPSWQRVLDLAYSRGDRAGVDYVFPFGPLGALGGWIELPHVYWLRWLGFDGLLFALASWFGARALRGGGWPAIALTLVALNVFPPIGDSRALLAMAYIAAGLVVRRRTASVELVLGLLALVAFGLVKFSWQILTCALVAILAVDAALRGPRRAALLVLAPYVVLYLLAWTLAGQSLADLGPYWRNSLELSRGYADAMGHEYGWASSVLPQLAMLGLLLATAAWDVRERGTLRESSSRSAIALATALMAFKIANINAPRLVTFVAVALGVIALVMPRWSASSRTWVAVRLATLAALLGVALTRLPRTWPLVARAPLTACERARTAVATFATLGERRRRQLADETAARERLACPRIAAEIGDEPIDVLGLRQGLATILAWNFRPRPVFQSYAAYTPALLELNAQYFAGERAPEFALLALTPWDRQLPLALDSASYEAVLTRYRPVLIERGALLMRRDDARAHDMRRELLLERPLSRGEWIELAPAPDGKLRRVSIAIEPSLRGAVRSALLRGAVPSLEVRTSARQHLHFRLVPGSARYGWWLDPLLTSQLDLQRWMSGDRLPWIAALRWSVAEGLEHNFEERARLCVELVDDPLDGRPVELARLLDPLLASPPSESSGDFWPQLDADGSDCLASHAPATLSWNDVRGREVLRGEVGVPASAVRDDGSQRLRVRLSARDELGRLERIDEREFVPRRELRWWTLEIDFELEEAQALVLELELARTDRIAGDFLLVRGLGPLARDARGESELVER